jgi:hypothetical protein
MLLLQPAHHFTWHANEGETQRDTYLQRAQQAYEQSGKQYLLVYMMYSS